MVTPPKKVRPALKRTPGDLRAHNRKYSLSDDCSDPVPGSTKASHYRGHPGSGGSPISGISPDTPERAC
uniref:Uncharacterized protein n=1 Tax=Desulfovibrio desulfuricans (strain ATCC 27774 / DSM 6949 / MB) TaxID=525146 RepID=B8IZ50_DESDA